MNSVPGSRARLSAATLTSTGTSTSSDAPSRIGGEAVESSSTLPPITVAGPSPPGRLTVHGHGGMARGTTSTVTIAVIDTAVTSESTPLAIDLAVGMRLCLVLSGKVHAKAALCGNVLVDIRLDLRCDYVLVLVRALKVDG